MGKRLVWVTVLGMLLVMGGANFYPVAAVISDDISGSVSVSGTETVDHDILIRATGTLTLESTAVLNFASHNPGYKITVNGRMNINAGAKLFLDAGCEIAVQNGGILQVGGTGDRVWLVPVNYPDSPTTLEGWQGIRNTGGNVTIRNTILWGANFGVQQNLGVTDIQDSDIQFCSSGIRSTGGNVTILKNNLTDNGHSIFLTSVTASLVCNNIFNNNTRSVVLDGNNSVDIRCNNFTDGNQTTIELLENSTNSHVNIFNNNFLHYRDLYDPGSLNFNFIVDNKGSVITVYNCYWSNQDTPYITETAIKAANLVSANVFAGSPASSVIDFSDDTTPPELVEVNPRQGAPGNVNISVVISDIGWGVDPATVTVSLRKGGTTYPVPNLSHVFNNRQYVFSGVVNLSAGDYQWSVDAYDLAHLQLTDPHHLVNNPAKILTISTSSGSVTSPAWSKGVYHLVTIPVTPYQRDQQTVLDFTQPDSIIARYQNNQYVYYGDPALENFAPGKGFWIKLGAGEDYKVRSIAGDCLTGDRHLTNLQPGWYLVGNPYANGDLDFNHISCTYAKPSGSNLPHGYLEAVADGVIAFGFWSYGASDYIFEKTKLETWKGYWIQIKKDCDLNFLHYPFQGSGTSAFNWDVQLTAAQFQGSDGGNYFGLAKTSPANVSVFNSEKPPAMGTSLRTYFLAPNSNCPYGTDYRSAGTRSERWSYAVTGLVPGQASITWAGVGAVPRNYQLVMKDVKTGAQIDLRQSSSYYFTVNGETRRNFEVALTDLSSPALRISNLQASKNYFSPSRESVTIRYNLSVDATVELRINDLAGNSVYVSPAVNGYAAANLNSFVWNGRNSPGKRVASGMYYCKIVAWNSTERTSQTVKVMALN
jgi:hypothetical protein